MIGRSHRRAESTYIAQFETDFHGARDEGIRIINATEGGVHIEGTEVLTLKSALEKCLDSQSISLPETQHLHITDTDHHNKVTARIRSVLSQLSTIERNSRRTAELIEKAQSCIEDIPRVDKYIKSMHSIRDQVLALHPGFDLVNYYNQKGALNRFKVDRSIKIVRISISTKSLRGSSNATRTTSIGSKHPRKRSTRCSRVRLR